ncbi:MAG: tetratricopeptide repeat protein [Frankiaceae bacterium]
MSQPPPEGGAGERSVRDQVERYQRLADVAASREDRLALLGHVARAQLELGRLREAEASLRTAVELAAELADQRGVVTSLDRLAAVVRQQNRPADAEPAYRRALAVVAAAGGAMADLEAELHQHYGDCLAELGRREEAVRELRLAVAAQRTGGDPAAVAAVERALDALGAADGPHAPDAPDAHADPR